MQNGYSDNIILFPKWKKALEAESLQAIKEKRYEEALEKLNKLIRYQITNHEIFIGKLICLIELERYEEAEELCENLIDIQDEHYYHYLHIYFTILFQTNQYSRLIEFVENELTMDLIPIPLKDQFTQLYELSIKMKQDIAIEKGKEYEEELKVAFEQEDYQFQWRIIEEMRKNSLRPPEQLIEALRSHQIHPVIKTTIFHWLQELCESHSIHIHKFGLERDVKPTDVSTIEYHTMVKQTMLIFNELEQQNPSLYQLLKQLLYRYIYVRYPFFPSSDDILSVAEALKIVGEKYMSLHSKQQGNIDSKVNHYMEEIELFQTLYLSVIEE